MSIKWIVLEEVKKNGVLIGHIRISEEDFEELFEDVKADRDDIMGFRQYKTILKNKGFNIEAFERE